MVVVVVPAVLAPATVAPGAEVAGAALVLVFALATEVVAVAGGGADVPDVPSVAEDAGTVAVSEPPHAVRIAEPTVAAAIIRNRRLVLVLVLRIMPLPLIILALPYRSMVRGNHLFTRTSSKR